MPLDITSLNQRIEKMEALRALAQDPEASTWIYELLDAARVDVVAKQVSEPIAEESRAPDSLNQQHGPDWWRHAIHAAVR